MTTGAFRPPTKPELEFTVIECERLLSITRGYRDTVSDQKLHLQERELTIGNGTMREAIIACENELYVVQSVVAKLWARLHPTG